MAELALAVVGSYLGTAAAAGAGYAAGAAVAFGMTGAQLGWLGGSLAGTLLQKGTHTVQPGIGDRTVQVSTYGSYKTRLYGTMRLTGNVIDGVSEVREVLTTTRVGKGGKSTNTAKSWNADIAIDLCQAGIKGIRKVWLGGKLVYDVSTGASAVSVIASSIRASSFVVYDGADTQLPDPTLEALHGVGNVPAYRGRSMIVIGGIDCPGGQIPQLSFECCMEIVPSATLPALTVAAPMSVDLMYADSTYTTVSRVCGPTEVYHMVANGADGAFYGYAFSAQCWLMGSGYKRLLWSMPLAARGSGAYSRMPGCNGSYKAPAAVRATLGTNGDLGTTNTVTMIDLLTGVETELRSFVPGSITYDMAPMTAARDEIDGLICIISNATGGRTYERFNPGIYSKEGGLLRRLATLNSTVGYPVAMYNGVVYLLDLRSGVSYVQQYSSATGAYIGETGGGPSLDITTQGVSQDPSTLVSVTGFATAISAHAGGVYVYSKTLGKSWRIDGAWLELSNTVPDSLVGPAGIDNVWIENDYVLEGPLTSAADALYAYRVAPHKSFDPVDVAAGDVISDIADQAGMQPAQLDVSLLAPDTLRGYMLTTLASGRAGIEPLLRAFFIDSREQDGVLQFVNRATQTSVVTIPYSDLASYEAGGEVPDAFPLSRSDQAILPRSFTTRYIDTDADYQPGAQVARRHAVTTEVDLSDDLPIAISAGRAATVAEVLLYDAWSARNSRRATLQRKYAYLSPADVVTIEYPENNYTDKRITRANDSGLIVTLELADAQPQLYGADMQGMSGPGGQDGPSLVAPTELALIDVHPLRDADDGNYVYAVMSPYADGGSGSVLYKGPDDATLAIAGSVTTAADIGLCTTTLGTWSQNTIDSVNTVTVDGVGTLYACTLDDAYNNGANLCAIGSESDGWELVQYLTPTLVSPGKYTLSNLRRGVRGTERFRGTHSANDRFVSLPTTGSGMVRVSLDLGEIDVPRNYRAISIGLSPDSQVSQSFASGGLSLKPLSPVNFKRSAVNGNSTITFDSRSRLQEEFPDGRDIAIGEASELYYIDVYSDSTFTLIVRTIQTNTPRAVYSLAQQTTDFGGYQLTLNLRISQVSALVGRGVPLEVTSTVANVTSTPPSLLAHFDGYGVLTTPIDSSSYAYAGALVGSAVLSDAATDAFGSSSLYSPGTGSGAEQGCRFDTAAATHSMGTGDFTVAYRFRPVLATSSHPAFSMAEPGPALPSATRTAFYISHNQSSGQLFTQVYDGSGVGVTITSSASAFVIGAMNHVALVRRSNVLYLFCNGLQVGSVAITHALNYTTLMKLNVGCWNGNSIPQTYFDEVMILKGEAYYFANFTPPTEAY